MNKDVRQLMRAARRQGLRVAHRGAHVRVTNPATGDFVTVPKTPSDRRWRKNSIADLRRIGFNTTR